VTRATREAWALALFGVLLLALLALLVLGRWVRRA
jgi:hypothetical protein